MAEKDKIVIIPGSQVDEVKDPAGKTFLGYTKVGNKLKTIRISFNDMIPLFGVSQTKGQSVTFAPSLKLFSDEINNKADTTNEQGTVVRTEDGKISVPENMVIYTGNSTIDYSKFERKNISLDGNGQTGGTNNAMEVIWRGELPKNSDITLRVPSSTDWKAFVYLHNATDTAPVRKLNCENAVNKDGYKTLSFTTTETAIYLTMYLRIVFIPENINYDISNTLEILRVSDDAKSIVIGADTVPLNRLVDNVIYVDDNNKVSLASASYKYDISMNHGTGSIAGSMGTGNSSTMLWRLKLKPNTTYTIVNLKTMAEYGYYSAWLHDTVNDVPCVKRYPITSKTISIETTDTAVYLSTFTAMTYKPDNIDFNITPIIEIIEGLYKEPSLEINRQLYPLSKIINNGNGGGTSTTELYYNVIAFGAKGDGVTDDTLAIQSAMDYAIDNGGGTVYFPTGKYRLATIQEQYGAKGHLIIKPKGVFYENHQWTQIRLLGQSSVDTASGYAEHSGVSDNSVAPWQNGSILMSDFEGEVQTIASDTPTAVLSAGGLVHGGMGLFNENQIVIENIAIQVKVSEGKYPLLSGINFVNALTVRAYNVFIYGSIPNIKQTAPSKDNHHSCGFIAPRVWCNPEQYLQGVYVKAGFRYGFIFSEHMQATNLSTWDCENAYVFAHMDHSASFGHLQAENCKNIIVSLPQETFGHKVGNSYIKIEMMNIESDNGLTPTDFNYDSFVLDSSNRLKGIMTYHIVKANVGADNSGYKQVGGSGLRVDKLF